MKKEITAVSVAAFIVLLLCVLRSQADEQLKHVSGSIFTGEKYNSVLSGVENTWTVSLGPKEGGQIQLGFIDMFLTASPHCNNSEKPYLKIEQVAPGIGGYYLTTSTALYTGSKEYVLCGSVDDLQDRVWILNATAVNITLHHLGVHSVQLALEYRGVHQMKLDDDCKHDPKAQVVQLPPEDASSYKYCVADFSVNDDEALQITLTNLKMEYSNNCEYIKLMIFEVIGDERNLLGKFCGVSTAEVLYSSSNKGMVVFETTDSVTLSQFHVSYKGIPKADVPQTIVGIVKLPQKSESSVNCASVSSCLPSFKRQSVNIFIWEINVPIGHKIGLSWNVSILAQNLDNRDNANYTLKIYDGLFKWTDNESLKVNLNRVSRGEQRFPQSKISIYLSILHTSNFSFELKYRSVYDAELSSFCTGPVRRENVVTGATILTSLKSSVIGNCVWVFRASNPNNFVKLEIDKISAVDNDCGTLGYAVYDGASPGYPNKMVGPFCKSSDPTIIYSTQRYMTVVLYKNRKDFSPDISAFISETDCAAVYSSSATPVNVDGRSCVIFKDIPNYSVFGDSVKTFRLLNKFSNATQIQVNPSPLSTGYKCQPKVGCLQYYLQEKPYLPTCSVNKIQTTLPARVLSFCPGSVQVTHISVTVHNVTNVVSKQCANLVCSNIQSTTSVPCGRYWRLPTSGNSGKLATIGSIPDTKCTLILSRRKENCNDKDGGFFRYRIRFTTGDDAENRKVFTITERLFKHPCAASSFEETRTTGVQRHGNTYVYYTVNTNYVAITVDTHSWFTVEFSVVEIPQPLLHNASGCEENYFHYQGNCYTFKTAHSKKGFTWNDAMETCTNEGAVLTSVRNEQEQLFLKQMLATHWRSKDSRRQYNLLFIGLKGQGSNGSWADGSQFRFAHWHRRLFSDYVTKEETMYVPDTVVQFVIPNSRLQPVFDQVSLCTVMYIPDTSVRLTSKTHWAKLPCNYPFGAPSYVCKKPAVGSSPSLPKVKIDSATSVCPQHWTYLESSQRCIKLETSQRSSWSSLNYSQAQGICAHIGGKIADIGTKDMNTMRYHLSLWKHQPQYRGIWLRQKNTTCRIIDIVDQKWDEYMLELDGVVGKVFDFQIKQWDCGERPPFIWDLAESESNVMEISKWLERKKVFPTGPLSVLCDRVVIESHQCGPRQHKCQDGTCIFEIRLCDGVKDCSGGDDEKGCTCEQKFRCSSGECIPYSLYCDHVSHCKDNSDELNCSYPRCSSGEFQCDDGSCIPRNNTCDFIQHCPSGEDERPDICKRTRHCKNGFSCYSDVCLPFRRTNDLVPDCPSFAAEDERLPYKDSLRGETEIHRPETGSITEIYIDYSPFCENSNEVRCYAEHTKCFKREMACVYNLDDYDQPKVEGCRDFSHLRNCSNFQCPGMLKCPNSYCIYFQRVCDGTPDCLNGEDEVGCESYNCPNLLRCPGKRNCIDQDLICDGKADCSHGEDEKYCKLPLNCPASCKCNTFSMDCVGSDLHVIPTYSKELRALFFSLNSLELLTNTFADYVYLGTLDISYNNITFIPPYAFTKLQNLVSLILKGNRLIRLDVKPFYGVNIGYLDLSSNALEFMSSNAFEGRVAKLDIQQNSAALRIEKGVFSKVHIELLTSDAFRFCCELNASAKCLPEANEFSTCDDMLADEFLSYAVWVVGMFAFVGNLAVFIWRLKTEKQNVNSFLVLNLSVSDFLMGVYLLIIGAADRYFKSQGKFYQYEEDWRNGFLCQLEGFVSTVACEMSVFILGVITVDRVMVLIFTFKFRSLSKKSAAAVVGAGWVVCCVIAAIPIIVYGTGYYGTTTVCLPFTLRNIDSKGWEYSTVVFLAINFVCFILIASGYIAIFIYARKQRMKSQRKSSPRDMALAERLILIVLTDFCCWVPICIIGAIALSGGAIGRQVSAWVAIFIMPINSALNPILYTFSSTNRTACCPSRQSANSCQDDTKMKTLRTKCRNEIHSDCTRESNVSTPDLDTRRGNLRSLSNTPIMSKRCDEESQDDRKYHNNAFASERTDSISQDKVNNVSALVGHSESEEVSMKAQNTDLTQNGNVALQENLVNNLSEYVKQSNKTVL